MGAGYSRRLDPDAGPVSFGLALAGVDRTQEPVETIALGLDLGLGWALGWQDLSLGAWMRDYGLFGTALDRLARECALGLAWESEGWSLAADWGQPARWTSTRRPSRPAARRARPRPCCARAARAWACSASSCWPSAYWTSRTRA